MSLPRCIRTLSAAARATADTHDSASWLGLSADHWVTLGSSIGAAMIAAVIAVAVYVRQQRAARAERRAAVFSEALRAVEDYLEAPYRIRRRDGSAQARLQITNHISDVKSRISFYCALIRLHASDEVAGTYDAYVAAAQATAGPQMTSAWRTRPTSRDHDVPLGHAYDQSAVATARHHVIDAMRRLTT